MPVKASQLPQLSLLVFVDSGCSEGISVFPCCDQAENIRDAQIHGLRAHRGAHTPLDPVQPVDGTQSSQYLGLTDARYGK